MSPEEGTTQNQRQRRQKAEKLTNLALLHTGVLQKTESETGVTEKKQRIFTNLALLPAEVLQMADSNKATSLSVTKVKHRSHLHT
jgi:hypothetical protein